MRLPSIVIAAAASSACAAGPLMTKSDVENVTCHGEGFQGSASIRCDLNQLVPTERLRIVEIHKDRIVLVGEKAEKRQRRVPGVTTPLTIANLEGGTYAIVIRAAGGELVPAGTVVVQPPRATERVEGVTDTYTR